MKLVRRLVVLIILIGIASLGIYRFQSALISAQPDDSEVATYRVQRRTLEDRVVNRGTVESQQTVYGNCELPGDTKIKFIVPEGSQVTKGQLVVELDSDQIDQRIQEKEIELNEAQAKLDDARQAEKIQLNKNQTDIKTAELEFILAEIDLEKYEKGTFEAERADLQRSITEGSAELSQVQDDITNTRDLVKKGYRTPQQLRGLQLREQQYQRMVERDQQKLMVLEEYERKRQITELTAKKEENQRKWERAKETALAEELKAKAAVNNAENGVKIVAQQLDQLKQKQEKAKMFASQDGIIAYANERWYDASRRIREGTEVYEGRAIYFLPDMNRMQVKVQVHESVVERIKKDQTATIRLDAFPERKLAGTVSSVASMAASSWSNIQNYDSIVIINELPSDMAIKPGMTAEVDVLVGTYPDVIAVPLNAVTEHFGRAFVYVKLADDAQRRPVKVGRMTHAFAEILEGLKEGDEVTLDAYQRGLQDFAENGEESAGGSASSSKTDAAKSVSADPQAPI